MRMRRIIKIWVELEYVKEETSDDPSDDPSN